MATNIQGNSMKLEKSVEKMAEAQLSHLSNDYENVINSLTRQIPEPLNIQNMCMTVMNWQYESHALLHSLQRHFRESRRCCWDETADPCSAS